MGEGKTGPFEYFERTMKVLSIIAIPVVVVWAGESMKESARQEEVRLEYVRLATSILAEDDQRADLRRWAVDVLNANSEIPLPQQTSQELASGQAILPSHPDGDRTVILDQNIRRILQDELRRESVEPREPRPEERQEIERPDRRPEANEPP